MTFVNLLAVNLFEKVPGSLFVIRKTVNFDVKVVFRGTGSDHDARMFAEL